MLTGIVPFFVYLISVHVLRARARERERESVSQTDRQTDTERVVAMDSIKATRNNKNNKCTVMLSTSGVQVVEQVVELQ